MENPYTKADVNFLSKIAAPVTIAFIIGFHITGYTILTESIHAAGPFPNYSPCSTFRRFSKRSKTSLEKNVCTYCMYKQLGPCQRKNLVNQEFVNDQMHQQFPKHYLVMMLA